MKMNDIFTLTFILFLQFTYDRKVCSYLMFDSTQNLSTPSLSPLTTVIFILGFTERDELNVDSTILDFTTSLSFGLKGRTNVQYLFQIPRLKIPMRLVPNRCPRVSFG